MKEAGWNAAMGEAQNEIDRLTRERDAYARAKAENDERFQLEAGEQRERADFYAGVLAEMQTLAHVTTGLDDLATMKQAVYRKAAWALDPLANHSARRA